MTSPSDPDVQTAASSITEIQPVPTDAEAAAIVAAIDALWPKPTEASDATDHTVDARWRFSGRWWNRSTPAAARRHRRPNH